MEMFVLSEGDKIDPHPYKVGLPCKPVREKAITEIFFA